MGCYCEERSRQDSIDDSQVQDQDQDQNLRTVFREIGNNNLHVNIDNTNVIVLVLVILGVLTGAVATDELGSVIETMKNNMK